MKATHDNIKLLQSKLDATNVLVAEIYIEFCELAHQVEKLKATVSHLRELNQIGHMGIEG
jgi:hypothetical protein